MICPLANFEEVYKTDNGAVFQCSRKNCYWLDFQGATSSFKIRDFFQFKNRIDSIDLENMINDSSRSSDYEIIMPFRSERIFILTVSEILQLKEILSGAKFLIEVNSEIKRCLQTRSVLAF